LSPKTRVLAVIAAALVPVVFVIAVIGLALLGLYLTGMFIFMAIFDWQEMPEEFTPERRVKHWLWKQGLSSSSNN